MAYLGDITLGDTLDFKFSTVGTTGAPTTLAGTPAVSAYVGNSLTQITAGITLTVDFDGVTGLHNVRVVASAGNGYAAQTNVDLVITTGTVGGTSVVGYVIGSFSIENRSTQALATAANLAVVAGYLDTEIAAIKAKTDNLPAAPAAVSDIPTAAAVADAVWDEAISGHLSAGSTGLALNSAGSAGDPWSTAVPGAYSVGTAGYILGTNLNATVSSRSTLDAAGVRTAVGLASANLDTQLDALPTAVENADALLGRNVSGGSSSGRTVKQAFHFIRNKWVVAAGTLTVYDTDDSTSSWTAAVTGTPGADPVTGNDPA